MEALTDPANRVLYNNEIIEFILLYWPLLAFFIHIFAFISIPEILELVAYLPISFLNKPFQHSKSYFASQVNNSEIIKIDPVVLQL